MGCVGEGGGACSPKYDRRKTQYLVVFFFYISGLSVRCSVNGKKGKTVTLSTCSRKLQAKDETEETQCGVLKCYPVKTQREFSRGERIVQSF